MVKATFWKLMLLAILPVALSSCNDSDGGLTPAERFEYETGKIDAYVAENQLNVAINETSGIRYTIVNGGDGIAPYVVDSVTVSYVARNLDTGEEVQSATEAKLDWGTLIIGVRAGLSYIQEGGAIRFFLPSVYAYGESGSANVPPNTTLIFDMELIEVHARQIEEDLVKIETYLSDSLSAVLHPNGFYYSIEEPGDNTKPNVFSSVSVNYVGQVMETGNVFDSGQNSSFVLGNLIAGWQVGLPLIGEGGTIRLYLPSPLAYGENGNPPSIPENAPLIFDIDLINVL